MRTGAKCGTRTPGAGARRDATPWGDGRTRGRRRREEEEGDEGKGDTAATRVVGEFRGMDAPTIRLFPDPAGACGMNTRIVENPLTFTGKSPYP
ncbi:hypothetical protein GCM10020221_06080 [Streptomyces thioluteus]|uniref:Uncharacterized protein n=1 Tax=Streptomyces thioluteus TaxID=66431 RepID=A0ABN3WF73_STRTU